MNIQLLTPKFLSNNIVTRSNQNSLNVANASHPNLKQLDKDTVSFSGNARKLLQIAELGTEDTRNKHLSNWSNDVTFALVCKVADEFEKPLVNLMRTLRRGLKDLVANDKVPNNPILGGPNGIKGRVKKPRSIAEKALSRKLFTQKEIEKMGDVAGARIIMRSGTQQDFDKLFCSLGDMVKRGELTIREIENYRLAPSSSYVSTKTLDNFEEVCNKAGMYPTRKEQAIPNGYTAIHLTAELPDGKLAEIQIMGRDMENVKEIEDFYYKYRFNKGLDPKYRPIQNTLETIMPTLDDFQSQALKKYIKDSYIHAKEITPRNSKKPNVTKDFLPFPYFLPQELSYANLYKMMDECDKVARKAK